MSLFEQIKESSSATKQNRLNNLPRCALGSHPSCCLGKGYILTTHGGVIRSKICDCVLACKACFGQARRLNDKGENKCHQSQLMRTVSLFNDSQVPARYVNSELFHFNNFSGNGKQIQHELTHWLEKFSLSQSPGILLTGHVGVGKTFLLASIAKSLIRLGVKVRFVDFFQLLSEIKMGYSQAESDLTYLQPLIDVDVLLIDELGKGRNSEFELTILDQLIMARYNARKMVIASTNYFLNPSPTSHQPFADSNELRQRVGERSYSRICEICQVFELTGKDVRTSK